MMETMDEDETGSGCVLSAEYTSERIDCQNSCEPLTHCYFVICKSPTYTYRRGLDGIFALGKIEFSTGSMQTKHMHPCGEARTFIAIFSSSVRRFLMSEYGAEFPSFSRGSEVRCDGK